MLSLHPTEHQRRALQRKLDAATTQDRRNRLGQFATPYSLAVDILTVARALLPPRAPIRFLDPAIGTGSFYAALMRVFPQSLIASALGFEIDPHYGHPARELWRNTPLEVRIDDFTRATPPSADDARATLIICNPPYVRHHHLSREDKRWLRQTAEHIAGVRLSGLAGLYCYFLCIAHGWLANGGVASWLIPSEFMDVNYGEPVKRYLLERVTLHRIHRFDPNDVQFEDALVSSAVVWFTKTPPPADHTVEFSYGGTVSSPKISTTIPVTTLRHSPKWTRYPTDRETSVTADGHVRLGDLFDIRRGVATGSNKFFVLTAEEAERHSLPSKFLTPILPSPRYLSTDEIEADEDGNPILERRLFLLNCSLPESEVEMRYPTLWRYLQSGMAAGIANAYLCSHRHPWYAQENRPPAPILCTYMGRQRTRNGRPFRFILNHSRAIAANVYLMLYPKAPLRKIVASNNLVLHDIWNALRDIPAERLLGAGRVYGGGLHKLEPRELANAPADSILAAIPELASKSARQLVLLDNLE